MQLFVEDSTSNGMSCASTEIRDTALFNILQKFPGLLAKYVFPDINGA
jgi:hypothetical protein